MGLYENIKALCADRGVPITRAEEEMGFSRGSLGKLREQESISSLRLEKISNYFGVPVDYIITGKERDEPVLTQAEKRLLAYFRALNDGNKKIIENTAKALNESNGSEASA